MKTTMMFGSIANPRRTTLAHLKDVKDVVDAAEPPAEAEERPEHRVDLPNRTANPRRTVLTEAPGL